MQVGKVKIGDFRQLAGYIVGFVAAAVSMSMGGCRAMRTDDVSLVSAVTVDVVIAVRLAVR